MNPAAWWLTAAVALACLLVAAVSVRRTLRCRRQLAKEVRQAEAEHLRLAGDPHACCRLVDVARCGLWCCHGGPCTAYLPGSYLPVAGLIHPLALARLTGPIGVRCCPLCGRPVSGYDVGEHGLYVTFIGGVEHRSVEAPWQFTPCGCMGRVIA